MILAIGSGYLKDIKSTTYNVGEYTDLSLHQLIKCMWIVGFIHF